MSPTDFTAQTPDFEQRVRDSFAKQGAMHHVGVRMDTVQPGRVVLSVPMRPEVSQQHGFMHGGILSLALDTACGYAALSLMPADSGVLTIEFKINFVAPARGQLVRLVGQVLKPGRTVTVVEGRAHAVDGEREKLCATMVATMMTVSGRDDIRN
ncbi:MAG: PaaI family thioesterase [Betaproteobacteria bacterium]|jgi:uncharacterized protein (TIGR00369 family)|nr:PaaI family thioesterase [Betaproteobacteria bacterium]NBS45588.1 PaaI family thioesterase [Betaproteobacteria bacterium]